MQPPTSYRSPIAGIGMQVVSARASFAQKVNQAGKVLNLGNKNKKVIKDETTSIHHNADSLCVGKADAQYYSVNYDRQTVAAMAAAYGTEAVAEAYYNEQVQNILKHYNAAEVASAGIFASKFLERKANDRVGHLEQ